MSSTVRKPVRRYRKVVGHIPQDPVRKSPDGVELACVRPLREEAHWGLIRTPPLWIDKAQQVGAKVFFAHHKRKETVRPEPVEGRAQD